MSEESASGTFRCSVCGQKHDGDHDCPRAPKGTHHNDDRTCLAYVYDGEELIAKLYKEQVLREFEESTLWTVTRTPAGDELD